MIESVLLYLFQRGDFNLPLLLIVLFLNFIELQCLRSIFLSKLCLSLTCCQAEIEFLTCILWSTEVGWLVCCFGSRYVGWLVGMLVGWLVGMLFGTLVGWLVGMLFW